MKKVKNVLIIVVTIMVFLQIINVKANNNDSITKSLIDYPRNNEQISDELKIQGWVLSKQANTEVEVLLDDTKIENIIRSARPDVLKAITGYGTIVENPTPGYSKIVDISELSYGNHRITINVLKDNQIILTDGVNFNHIPPKTLINIDFPKTNEQLSGNLKIQGWVMSQSKNVQVKAKIDGTEIEALDRSVRSDVIKAINGYGTIEENPTPGYQKNVDISNYTYGNHTLEIQALDKKGRIVSQVTRVFKVRAPKTLINIDYPSTSKQYGKTVSFKVQGWIMSEVRNIKTELQIDGNTIRENINTVERPDVIKAIKGYGTIEENPTPGFYDNIDISNLTYGRHTVKIIVKDTENKLITESNKQFEIVKPKTLINIDYPTTTGKYKHINKLKIQGWIMSELANPTLEVYIDGIKKDINFDRSTRSDVIKSVTGYGTVAENPTPGFYKEIDIKDLSYGKHTLKIVAKDSINEIIKESSRTFEIIKPTTKIYIQKPLSSATIGLENNIDGWVMSEEKDVYVKLFVGSTEIAEEVNRVERPDVIKAITGYGTIEENPTPGFTVSHSFDGLKDGKNTITAKAYSSITNEEIASTSVSPTLKKYTSKMVLDFPALSTINSTGELTIQGWAITTGKENIVKGYIDGNELSLIRTGRPDVLNAYPAYNLPVNGTAGFQTTINISGYKDGVHTLTIKLYDELNEVIETYTKKIQTYKNVFQGIDVSEFNGTINWPSVAKSGINFAIIRIGYRGYGTGKMVKDAKFEENYNGARNAGLKVGIYFFSQAINYNEGVEEAAKAVEWLNNRPLQYPIAFDTENSTGYPNGRADKISINARTDAARGFCNQIIASKYKASIYASRDWFYHNLNMVSLASYDEWLAHYTEDQNIRSNYTGRYQVWQYTSSGSVSGISGKVDRNVSYYNYS